MASRIIAQSIPPSFGPIADLVGHAKPGLNCPKITDKEVIRVLSEIESRRKDGHILRYVVNIREGKECLSEQQK